MPTNIYLPLFSEVGGLHVPLKSGLNLWNASGRTRDCDEVYITVPSTIHRLHPEFFPDRDVSFNLILPDEKILVAKICQQGGKALMTYPNKELGKWILRDVLGIVEGELLKIDDLEAKGIYSVNVIKVDEFEFKILPSSLEDYEKFRLNENIDYQIDTLIEAENEDNLEDNDEPYEIVSWGADLSFRELISMYDDDELLKPELQRKFVWTKVEASRFIESILLGLPVPSIFLAKQNEDKLIVDGYQRIMAVYQFVKTGIFSGDNKVFKLSNSKQINSKWRGRAFSELTKDEQKRIKSTTIHAIIFDQKSPSGDSSSLYQIFERINTTGKPLKPQEIRNCIYQGSYNDLLIKLNEYDKWRWFYKLDEPDVRMQDIEYILRFEALSSDEIKTSDASQISLKKFLNDFMGSEANKEDAVLDTHKKRFIRTIDFIYENIGLNAFHNLSTRVDEIYVERFHPTIFDAIMIATDYVLENELTFSSEGLEEKRVELLKDKEFINFISQRTTNLESIRGRIKLAIEKLYGVCYEQ